MLQPGHHLRDQLRALGVQFRCQAFGARDVAARSRQAAGQAGADSVVGRYGDDGNSVGRVLRSERRQVGDGDDDIDFRPDQFGGHPRSQFGAALRGPNLDDRALPVCGSKHLKALAEIDYHWSRRTAKRITILANLPDPPAAAASAVVRQRASSMLATQRHECLQPDGSTPDRFGLRTAHDVCATSEPTLRRGREHVNERRARTRAPRCRPTTRGKVASEVNAPDEAELHALLQTIITRHGVGDGQVLR